VEGTTVTATVDGAHAYRVRLDVTRFGLRGQCSCPSGVDGAFCEHRVAVALGWLERGSEVREEPRKPLSDKQLRSFLLGRDQKWLVDQLMAAATSDKVLRARLGVAGGDDPAGAFDDQELRDRLAVAIEVGDYIDDDAGYAYLYRVDDALDAVEKVLEEGSPPWRSSRPSTR
jgi:uncharacterized Zn finger protein